MDKPAISRKEARWLEVHEAALLLESAHTLIAIATRFGRQTSTVRTWLERGLFPGAYKFMGGREWRVPPEALAAFEAGQRAAKPQNGAGKLSSNTVDLGAWRREPEAS